MNNRETRLEVGRAQRGGNRNKRRSSAGGWMIIAVLLLTVTIVGYTILASERGSSQTVAGMSPSSGPVVVVAEQSAQAENTPERPELLEVSSEDEQDELPPSTEPSPSAAPLKLDPDKPVIALSFDDGPSNVTPRILSLLDKHGIHATFFLVGNRVEEYADTAREIISQGSEIGGHSWDHKSLKKMSDSGIAKELNSTNDIIEETVGVRPKIYRPPYGAVNDAVSSVSKDLGLSIINWSVDTLDWKSRNAQAVYNEIMKYVEDGSIILCHDLYASTADAMEMVIPELIDRGYQFVTVSELLQSSGDELEAGMIYLSKPE